MLTRCSYGIRLALALRINGPSASKCFGPIASISVQLRQCTMDAAPKAPDKGEVGGSSPPRPTIILRSGPEFLPTTAQADQKSSMDATWPEPEASRASLVTSAAPSF